MAVRVLGVDGCKGGWVAVALEDGQFAGSRFVEVFETLVEDPATVIAVDTPIGETTLGDRAAERAMRAFLKPKGASVFTPPPLASAEARDYEAAKAIAHELTGKMISKQSWYLLSKMLDVVDHWHAAPTRIREVHPECCFRAMHGQPLSQSKKTWTGIALRIRLLREQGVDLVRGPHDVAHAKSDDVIDAAAAAWSAHRIATGVAFSLPHPPEPDAEDRPVAVWV